MSISWKKSGFSVFQAGARGGRGCVGGHGAPKSKTTTLSQNHL